MDSVGHSPLLKFLVSGRDTTMSETITTNIESEVPGKQNLRGVGDNHFNASENETHKNNKDESLKDINEKKENKSFCDVNKSEIANADDLTLDPVITITKQEATFSKGDLKLQKVIVTEDISHSTNNKENDENANRRLTYETPTKLPRPTGSTNEYKNNANHPTVCTTAQETIESKRIKTRIPMARFRQAVDKVKRERKEKETLEKENDTPLKCQTRKSSIPRLKDNKISQTHPTKETNVVQKDLNSIKTEEEFDKIFEAITPTEDVSFEIINSKVENVNQLERSFEEIIHAYEENKVHPINIDKDRPSKIPLLKRKSVHEIEVPKNKVKTTLKKSISVDATKAESSNHEKTTTYITEQKNITRETISKNYTQTIINTESCILQNENTYTDDFVTAQCGNDKRNEKVNNNEHTTLEDTAVETNENVIQYQPINNNKIKETVKTATPNYDSSMSPDEIFKNKIHETSTIITTNQNDNETQEMSFSENSTKCAYFDKQTIPKMNEKDVTEITFYVRELAEKTNDDDISKINTNNTESNENNDKLFESDSQLTLNTTTAENKDNSLFSFLLNGKDSNNEVNEAINSKINTCNTELKENKTFKINAELFSKTTSAENIELGDDSKKEVNKEIKLEININNTESKENKTLKIDPELTSITASGENKELCDDSKKEVKKVINSEINGNNTEPKINKNFKINSELSSETTSTEPKELSNESRKEVTEAINSEINNNNIKSNDNHTFNIDQELSSKTASAVNKERSYEIQKVLTTEINFKRKQIDVDQNSTETIKDTAMEEDIIILKGKVNRIIRRISSVDSSKQLEKESCYVPRKKSILSKIAMFERDEPNEPFPKTRIPKLESKVRRELTTQRQTIKEFRRPKVVNGLLKDTNEPLTNLKNTKEKDKTAEINSYIETSVCTQQDKSNNLKLENGTTGFHNNYKCVKEVVNEIEDSKRNSINNQTKIVKMSIQNNVVSYSEEKNINIYSHTIGNEKIVEQKTTERKLYGGNDESIIQKNNTSNYILELANDEGRNKIANTQINDEVLIKRTTEKTKRKELKSKEETDIRRTQSVAELDLGNVIKGKVHAMVMRINSIDRLEYGRKEIISEKERPRKRSVSEKIALFEGKLSPARAEKTKESPKKVANATELSSEQTDEEEFKQKITELSKAKATYGVINTTYIELRDGSKMPAISLGTALLDKRLIKSVVEAAIDLGYRAIDTAYIYGNEKEVGEAINNKIKDGTVKREDLYIVTKLWSTFHRRDLVEKACRNSLEVMGLTYFDLILIHNPMSLMEENGPLPKIANVLQFSEHDYLEAWYGIEDLIAKKLVLRGGISNFNSEQVHRVFEKGQLKPVVNQVECHPYLSQEKLAGFCDAFGMKLNCYGALGSKGTPAELKSGLSPVIDDPLVLVMAAGLGITPAQLLIAYQLHNGRSVTVKATSALHLHEDLAAQRVRLQPAHLTALNALNRNKRTFTFMGLGETHKNYPFKIAF